MYHRPAGQLHAHLTGSISVATLHEIWVQRKAEDADFVLEDPLIALPAGKVDYDVFAFVVPPTHTSC